MKKNPFFDYIQLCGCRIKDKHIIKKEKFFWHLIGATTSVYRTENEKMKHEKDPQAMDFECTKCSKKMRILYSRK